MSGKVLVAVKRVIDYAVKVRVTPDKLGVVTKNIKMSMNPFCEIAVEQAVRFKEAGLIKEVIAVSIGKKDCQETLRTALAMGADKALHVKTDVRTDFDLHPLAVAKIFKALAMKYDPSLILVGKQSIDSDMGQVCQMISGLLGWSQGTFASKLAFNEDKTELNCIREIDGGLTTQILKLPAVVSCDLRLNEPRYATLPNIMKARKKKIEEITPDKLEVDIAPRLKYLQIDDPPTREPGRMLGSVEELISELGNKGLV